LGCFNAYDLNFFNNEMLHLKFDIIIDDGPHTLESMIFFIENYSKLLEEDGILVVEDVQSIEWIDILKNVVPENLKQYISVYDLRDNKNRYDDILFVIDKSNK
jgi:predicted methyltransferase